MSHRYIIQVLFMELFIRRVLFVILLEVDVLIKTSYLEKQLESSTLNTWFSEPWKCWIFFYKSSITYLKTHKIVHANFNNSNNSNKYLQSTSLPYASRKTDNDFNLLHNNGELRNTELILNFWTFEFGDFFNMKRTWAYGASKGALPPLVNLFFCM